MMNFRKNCSFAMDGTCKLPPENCRMCKVTPKESAFHRRLCIGTLTWADVERLQGKREGEA